MKLTPAACSFALASLSALALTIPAQAVQVDSTFHASIQGGIVNAISVGANGILIGGDFNQVNGAPASRLVKLGLNGLVDSSFGRTPLDGAVYGIANSADGSVYIAGGFSHGLARLKSDGTLDGTFTGAGNPNGRVQALALSPDGSPVIGGSFQQIGSAGAHFVSRFTSNGSL